MKYLLAIIPLVLFAFPGCCSEASTKTQLTHEINLPDPDLTGKITIEQTLASRRSLRSYKDKSVSINHLSQLLWSAQGITEPSRGFRTSPSAGATYPMELYVFVGNVESLSAGIYHYDPAKNALALVKDKDMRTELMRAALNQNFIGNAPISILLTSFNHRTTQRYGARGEKYILIEAGHIAQNISLQAEALGMGAVCVGAFDNNAVQQLFKFDSDQQAVYLLSIGYKP